MSGTESTPLLLFGQQPGRGRPRKEYSKSKAETSSVTDGTGSTADNDRFEPGNRRIRRPTYWSDKLPLSVAVLALVMVAAVAGVLAISNTYEADEHETQHRLQVQQEQLRSSPLIDDPAAAPVGGGGDDSVKRVRGSSNWRGSVGAPSAVRAEEVIDSNAPPVEGGDERHSVGVGWRSMAMPKEDTRDPGQKSKEPTEKIGTKTSSGRSASKPNVFFFLIDDMGHGDIGYQSTDLSEMTPNLDALAAGGIKLKNFYSMTLCTPARAAMMTGRYPIRYGLQYSVLTAGSAWGLPLDEKIFPQYMNDFGYESHMVGKWHLGSYNDESLPSRRGFETYMGYLNGEDTYYTHRNLEAMVDDKLFFDFGFGNATDYYDISKKSTGSTGVSCPGQAALDGNRISDHVNLNPTDVCYTGMYSTDAFLGRARQVVNSKTPYDEKPLYLYVAHQSVHSPVGPAPADGFTPEEQALLDDVLLKTGSAERVQFAGVVMYLDKRLGQFLDILEEGGWLENSIIVLASDNGGCPGEGGSNYPLRGVKQSMFEGGSKVPAFIWSKSHVPEERWGTEYHSLMHTTDWLPTLASALGEKVTASVGPLDGIDHWDSLISSAKSEGEHKADGPRHELLYNWDPYILSSSNGLTLDLDLTQGAFRVGKWKLIFNSWCSGFYSFDLAIIATDPLLNGTLLCGTDCQCQDCFDVCQDSAEYKYSNRLVDLDADPREEHNLIDEYPEIAGELRRRALEVVFAEWTGSGFQEVNEDSYLIWEQSDWWMKPWLNELAKKSPLLL